MHARLPVFDLQYGTVLIDAKIWYQMKLVPDLRDGEMRNCSQICFASFRLVYHGPEILES